MDYLPVLKLLSLLLLLDLGSASEYYKTYDQIHNGIDWRQYGYISPVQDQGDCEASWALSAVGAIEAHMAIKNCRFVELSAQQLIDCSQQPNSGCSGGSSSLAFNYTRDNGITSKASYPYRAGQSTCSYNPRTSLGSIRGYVNVRSGDEEHLAEVVYNIGPVVVKVDGLDKSMYDWGVYFGANCRNSRFSSSALVVGFGTDSNHVQYWILKTSFGPNWGENGYMRLARNAGNMCGVATLAQYPIV